MFGALGGGAGWYGNEPEAKMGAASMHSKAFGSLAEEYEYLGSMKRGNTTTLFLIVAAAYAFLRLGETCVRRYRRPGGHYPCGR